jgi:hypothetical protein
MTEDKTGILPPLLQKNRYFVHIRTSFHEVLKRESLEATKNFVELTGVPIIIDDLWFLYHKGNHPEKELKAKYISETLLAKDYYFSYVPNNLVWKSPEMVEILIKILDRCVGKIPQNLVQLFDIETKHTEYISEI